MLVNRRRRGVQAGSRRVLPVAALALLVVAGAHLALDAAVRPPRLDYQISTLDNGLTVVMLEDHSTPIVHLQL
ncbi:MAG: hypothetical protein EHM89_08230, partial [Acidobacteria bacterium]